MNGGGNRRGCLCLPIFNRGDTNRRGHVCRQIFNRERVLIEWVHVSKLFYEKVQQRGVNKQQGEGEFS